MQRDERRWRLISDERRAAGAELHGDREFSPAANEVVPYPPPPPPPAHIHTSLFIDASFFSSQLQASVDDHRLPVTPLRGRLSR